jgi:Q family heterogeneous nuclear ribonucleoprotein R
MTAEKKQESLHSGDSSDLNTSEDMRRGGNSDMEEISGMVDKLLSLSVGSQEEDIVSAASLDKKNLCLKQDRSSKSGSRYFPLRSDSPVLTGKISYTPKYPMVGPNEEKVAELLSKTGYQLVVSPRQRMYGNPPPNWSGPEPGKGCQLFVGKIPKQFFEDALVPLFDVMGPLYSMRIMMEGPPSVLSRGFAFVTYTCAEDAARASKSLDGFEIMKGRFLKVALSEPNCRLFIGNVAKNKSIEEIKEHILITIDDIESVIAFQDPNNEKKNRGFCFIDFKSHTSASHHRKRLLAGVDRIFGRVAYVDWADPLIQPDEDVLKESTSVFVTKLPSSMSEDILFEVFSKYGNLVSSDFYGTSAKIHYDSSEAAAKAVEDMNGKIIQGFLIKVEPFVPKLSVTNKAEIMFRRFQRRLNAMNDAVRLANPNNNSIVLPNAVQMFLLQNNFNNNRKH